MDVRVKGWMTAELDEERCWRFWRPGGRLAAGRAPGPRGMVPLLSYLREAGVTPAARPPQAPAEALLGEYRIWLVRERGLAAATVLRYENTARRFLAAAGHGRRGAEPGGLTGADVNAFLLRECGRVSAGRQRGGWLSFARCCVSFICAG